MEREASVRCGACLVFVLWFLLLGGRSAGQDESSDTRRIVRDRPGSQKWALLIGVDDYIHVNDLSYCGRDVADLTRRFIELGFPEDHVFVLHDDAPQRKNEPYKSNIDTMLELLLGTFDESGSRLKRQGLVSPDDLVVVAFSGHGVHLDGASYFCPIDARLDRPSSLVSLDRLYRLLSLSPAGVKLLLVDACRNDPRPGGTRELKATAETAGFAGSLEKPPKGVLVLSSCAPGQVSVEDKDLEHGVFMNYLLEGLAGEADRREGNRNDRVSLLELYRYSHDRTKTHVVNSRRILQTPELYGRITGDFEFGERASMRVGPKPPLGLPPVPMPEDNPMTAEKIELGKLLYFDKRLSKDGTISCATCHDPKMAWTENEPTSTGIHGQVGGVNSPTVINSAYAKSQFWDGRAASLEEQALGPIENPIEMGHELDELVPQLNEIAGYRERFQEVFGTDVTKEGIAKAIAAFERTVLSGNSPYDQFQAGDENALTDAQKKGMKLFGDAGCSTCHAPPLFSSYRFYNAGVGMGKDPPDYGREAVTGKDDDLGKFRVPALREVANTGPYFHDGSCDALEKAVAMMAGGGMDNPLLSPMMKAVHEKQLSAEGQASIVEFLKALSGDSPVTEPPELP